MNLILDTHLLLWAAAAPERLSTKAQNYITSDSHHIGFSVASLWEIAIKSGLGREDFVVDTSLLRRELLERGYQELSIKGRHATEVCALPPIHKDPFDRLLVAQARVEGNLLVTNDPVVARYPGPIEWV